MSSFPDFNLSMSALRRRNALLPAALSQSLFDLFDPAVDSSDKEPDAGNLQVQNHSADMAQWPTRRVEFRIPGNSLLLTFC
jgi:hypothetical protein